MRILLDLDDVLVDFSRAACKLHGTTPEELVASGKWTLGTWDLSTVLGISLDQFWEPIHREGSDFWTNLEELPHAQDLIDLVKSITADWWIVSAPSREDSSYTGKVRWLKNRFGKTFSRFVLTPHKEALIGKNKTVLIDDRKANCRLFCVGGGYSILFPSWGNEYRDNKINPLCTVAPALDGYNRINVGRM